jgi:FkbM family methyltransferase
LDEILRGTNSLDRHTGSKALIKQFTVGFIIDDTKSCEKFQGVPVISLVEFKSLVEKNSGSKDEYAVISAVGGRPLTAKRKLSAIGVDQLDYFKFKHFSELVLPEIPMNEDFKGELERNSIKFQEVYNCLADEVSKSIFLKLLKFRLTYDLTELDGFTEIQEDQYFEDFLDISENPGLLDIGCFDGFTTLKFIEKYPNFAKVIALEPEYENFLRCKKLFSSHPNQHSIRVLNVGVGLKAGRFRVMGTGSTTRLIDANQESLQAQDLTTEVMTVDQMNLPKYDRNKQRINWLIKMDIEGMEYEALIGATETIKHVLPTLAISVYHKPIDLWRIADLVGTISDDYKVYIRHYTESIYETIMFFIPIPK